MLHSYMTMKNTDIPLPQKIFLHSEPHCLSSRYQLPSEMREKKLRKRFIHRLELFFITLLLPSKSSTGYTYVININNHTPCQQCIFFCISVHRCLHRILKHAINKSWRWFQDFIIAGNRTRWIAVFYYCAQRIFSRC